MVSKSRLRTLSVFTFSWLGRERHGWSHIQAWKLLDWTLTMTRTAKSGWLLERSASMNILVGWQGSLMNIAQAVASAKLHLSHPCRKLETWSVSTSQVATLDLKSRSIMTKVLTVQQVSWCPMHILQQINPYFEWVTKCLLLAGPFRDIH